MGNTRFYFVYTTALAKYGLHSLYSWTLPVGKSYTDSSRPEFCKEKRHCETQYPVCFGGQERTRKERSDGIARVKRSVTAGESPKQSKKKGTVKHSTLFLSGGQ